MPEIFVGDCRELLHDLPDECIDAIVTDPPYGLEFMGKDWDAPWKGEDLAYLKSERNGLGIPKFCARTHATKKGVEKVLERGQAFQLWCEEWARECLRVLRPGGHLLAFGGTRTYHRMACAIEDAGFEVRDSLHWIYGSGFPKSLDVSKAIDKASGAERKRIPGPRSGGMAALNKGNAKQGYRDREYYEDGNMMLSGDPATDEGRKWQGWGTALKPAHEPIVVARKPVVGTVAANVLAHGTGALNINGTRVEYANPEDFAKLAAGVQAIKARGGSMENSWKNSSDLSGANDASTIGRWPPNVLLSHSPECGDECAEDCAVAEMDRQSGQSVSRKAFRGKAMGYDQDGANRKRDGVDAVGRGHDDAGGASRFFPCFHYGTKAGRKEREAGCDSLPPRSGAQAVERGEGSDGMNSPRAGAGRTASEVRNHHPTVKSVSVMRWLVKLVTPPNGVVLDPFAGSGTTGVACVHEGFEFVGFEQSAEYAAIAEARIAHAQRTR